MAMIVLNASYPQERIQKPPLGSLCEYIKKFALTLLSMLFLVLGVVFPLGLAFGVMTPPASLAIASALSFSFGMILLIVEVVRYSSVYQFVKERAKMYGYLLDQSLKANSKLLEKLKVDEKVGEKNETYLIVRLKNVPLCC